MSEPAQPTAPMESITYKKLRTWKGRLTRIETISGGSEEKPINPRLVIMYQQQLEELGKDLNEIRKSSSGQCDVFGRQQAEFSQLRYRMEILQLTLREQGTVVSSEIVIVKNMPITVKPRESEKFLAVPKKLSHEDVSSIQVSSKDETHCEEHVTASDERIITSLPLRSNRQHDPRDTCLDSSQQQQQQQHQQQGADTILDTITGVRRDTREQSTPLHGRRDLQRCKPPTFQLREKTTPHLLDSDETTSLICSPVTDLCFVSYVPQVFMVNNSNQALLLQSVPIYDQSKTKFLWRHFWNAWDNKCTNKPPWEINANASANVRRGENPPGCALREISAGEDHWLCQVAGPEYDRLQLAVTVASKPVAAEVGGQLPVVSPCVPFNPRPSEMPRKGSDKDVWNFNQEVMEPFTLYQGRTADVAQCFVFVIMQRTVCKFDNIAFLTTRRMRRCVLRDLCVGFETVFQGRRNVWYAIWAKFRNMHCFLKFRCPILGRVSQPP